MKTILVSIMLVCLSSTSFADVELGQSGDNDSYGQHRKIERGIPGTLLNLPARVFKTKQIAQYQVQTTCYMGCNESTRIAWAPRHTGLTPEEMNEKLCSEEGETSVKPAHCEE